VPFAIADVSRTIIIASRTGNDLEERIGAWLIEKAGEARFSLAELANPSREAGQPSHVLAIAGLHETLVERLVEELQIEVEQQPFRSSR
jgi:hypothetical protein